MRLRKGPGIRIASEASELSITRLPLQLRLRTPARIPTHHDDVCTEVVEMHFGALCTLHRYLPKGDEESHVRNEV